MTLAASVVVVASCSDQPTAPTAGLQQQPAAAARGASALSVAPVSPGWQEQARALVAANRLTSYAAARIYAALSVAQYLAVVTADGHFDVEGTLPEHGLGEGGRQLFEARRGAVAGASLEVLSYFFSKTSPDFIATLRSRLEAEAAAGPGSVHPQYTRGLEIGVSAGRALLARAEADHFTDPWSGIIPTGDGKWVANGSPAGAMLAGTTPYLLASAGQFRPDPPPTFGSTEFFDAAVEVRALAGSTPALVEIARQWNYGTGTFTPPGYWNETAASYIRASALDERAATHVFALMHVAVMDALIGCWEAKLFYWVLRPTQFDPTIALALPPLPNHPSYPSGHSCGSAAAARVLTYFFPDPAAPTAMLTPALEAQVTEAGMSRIYGGIHYRFDIVAGQELGVDAANWAIGLDEGAGLLDAMHWSR